MIIGCEKAVFLMLSLTIVVSFVEICNLFQIKCILQIFARILSLNDIDMP